MANDAFLHSDAPESLTLGELIDTLGEKALSVRYPGDLDAVVRDFEVYEDQAQLDAQREALLLVPGARSFAAGELAAVHARVSELGYPGVVVSAGVSDPARPEGSATALLRLTPGLGWKTFEGLLSHTLSGTVAGHDLHFVRGHEPLFTLTNEVAEQFGGAVAIEDLGRRVIAYSTLPGQLIDDFRTQGVLARQVPDSPVNDAQYREVMRHSEPTSFAAIPGEHARVAIAIRAGAYPLGSLWAITPDPSGSLGPTHERVLRQAAGIAAGYMLEDIRAYEAMQLQHEHQLRSLLEGRSGDDDALAGLGLFEVTPSVLVSLAPADAATPQQLSHLKSVMRRQLSLRFSAVVLTVYQGRIFALHTGEGRDPAAGDYEQLMSMLDRLVATGTTLVVAGQAATAAEVGPLVARALSMFGILHDHPRENRVVTVADVRPELLIERVQGDLGDAPELQDPSIARLVAERPATAHALLTWLSTFGNVSRAASQLGVHENTVRNHLKRASAVVDLAGSSPAALLACWLQLQALTPHDT